MVSRFRRHETRWLWLALALSIVLLLMFVRPFASPRRAAGAPLLLNVTLGAVSCPHSLIVGWTLGHNWSSVSNVVNCAQGRAPAMWLQVWWGSGRRTSLCYDPGRVRCRPQAETPLPK